MTSSPRCVICKRPVLPRGQNSAFPFCSERCKLLDLGKWLDEQYRVTMADGSDNENGEDIQEKT